MAFKLKPVDDDFLRSAPERAVGVFEIPRPAAEVWAELVADDTLSWCMALAGVKWTSSRPFGVGTTRTAKAGPLGVLALKEIFFHWEEGKRKSFYVESTNLPLARRFAEDYLVEEVSPSSCRFTWTIASESPLLTRPANALVAKSLFRDTKRHFSAT